ncbi:MAG TPA: phage minor head protein [Dehalococcoidia bacterium]
MQAAYRRKLDALIEEMAASVSFWIESAYRNNEPLAQDELPASALKAAIRKLTARWQRKFSEAAPKLADYFATAVEKRSSAALKNILKEAGFTVEFKMTAAQRDIVNATINQNVQLIKSIPAQYLTQVQGSVMRSVQTGRDLGTLSKELQDHYGVTKRRAAFIARSQNNLATSSMDRARRLELGLDESQWMHSGGGKHPRPTHVAMSGKRFKTEQGMWDSAVKRYVFAGCEPGCRCVSRAVVKGFS